MKNLLLYGLGGAATVLVLAAVVKRRPSSKMLFTRKSLPSPRAYIAVKGDHPAKVANRFGVSLSDFIKYGQLYQNGRFVPFRPGLVVPLPPDVADTGPRAGAQGVAR